MPMSRKVTTALALLTYAMLAALACARPKAHVMAATAPGVPNPVNIVDGTGAGSNILGTTSNPLVTTGGGGGGSSSVTVINDAGNAIPVTGPIGVLVDGGQMIGSDTVPAELLNSVADQVTVAVQGTVKGSAGTFVGVSACNEGTVTGWLMFFDQGGNALDAGALAGTAPKWMGLRTPAGGCVSLSGVRSFTNGLNWYSSGQAGTLDAGLAPNFTTETFYR